MSESLGLRKSFISILLSFLCVLLPGMSLCAYAGDDGCVVSDQPAEIGDTESAEGQVNYSTFERDGQTIYLFEGKEYVPGSPYGIHILTGYSSEETGSAQTTNGNMAMARHTIAAASDLPIGTVLIITGVSGPHKDMYNGMYVVEDRGGYYVESEGWLDIYCDSYEEAVYVTNDGFNYVEAIVAVPLE